MKATAGALRTLHRIHQQLRELRDRRDQGPKQIRARELGVANLEQKRDKVQEETRQARMSADQKQLDLRSIEDRTLDWKAKLNSCGSNKEYQTLLEQIAAAEMTGSVLSDEILELFERIDGLEGEVREAMSEMEKAEQDLERARQQVSASADAIVADLERLERELSVAEGALPTDLRTDYQRVIRAQGVDGLAVVDGTYCGGCYQQLTANMQNSLALEQSVCCSSCGRLLYPVEGDSAV